MRRLVGISVGAALFAFALAAPRVRASDITIVGTASAGGYTFTNFDGPGAGTAAAAGTNANGISNTGTVAAVGIADNGGFTNYTANPLTSTNANVLNINGSTAAMAFGVNSSGTVVGNDGNGNAFSLSSGGTLTTFIPNNGASATAFGINDGGTIVGQYTTSGGSPITPGFIQEGSKIIAINAPTGASGELVNAQGINNNGLVVGFYVGSDGQDHGFTFQQSSAVNGAGAGTAVADPTIPSVPGEPGAKFVFSQILGVNDQGIAVGYYGDSTSSQHGFIYNTNTGQYTFLDDPSEQFNSDHIEVTQITGINNAGEITGFYSTADGVFHGFVATASVPEPASLVLMGLGLASVAGANRVRRARAGRRAGRVA